MNLRELFQTKKDNVIGTFECSTSDLASKLLSLLKYMGMANPPKVTVSSKKAVGIVRKDNGDFKLVLYDFNPPLEIEWTDLINKEDLQNTIFNFATNKKKVAFVNQQLFNNEEFFQFAVC